MAETMSSGTEFHIVPVPETARDVASPNNLVDAADDVSVMVQGGPRPTHEDDIVDRILGVQEHAHRLIPDDHVVDDPEAETGVEGCRLLNIRRMHLVVIEAKRTGSAKAFKSLIDSFESWHGRAGTPGAFRTGQRHEAFGPDTESR